MPRDETFSEVKGLTFSAKTIYSVIHAVLPSLENAAVDSDFGFPYFTAIDSLFNEGVDLGEEPEATLFNLLPRLVKSITDQGRNVLLFETPELLDSTNKISLYVCVFLGLLLAFHHFGVY